MELVNLHSEYTNFQELEKYKCYLKKKWIINAYRIQEVPDQG